MNLTFLDSIFTENYRSVSETKNWEEVESERSARMRRKTRARKETNGGEADGRKIKGEKLCAGGREERSPHPSPNPREQISAVITNKFSTRNEVRKRERVNPKVRPKGVRSYFWYLADGKPGGANEDQRREERMLRREWDEEGTSKRERESKRARENERSSSFPSRSRMAESS